MAKEHVSTERRSFVVLQVELANPTDKTATVRASGIRATVSADAGLDSEHVISYRTSVSNAPKVGDLLKVNIEVHR